MNEQVQTVDYGYALPAEQRNKVLRNTYWLLALSLVPTVLGAWLGVATGITRGLSRRHRPDRLPGRRLRLHVRHREDQELGGRRAVLLAFTFFMGLMLSRLHGDGAGLQERHRPR